MGGGCGVGGGWWVGMGGMRWGLEADVNRMKGVLGRFCGPCFTSHQSARRCHTNVYTNNMLLERRKGPMEKQCGFQANNSGSSEQINMDQKRHQIQTITCSGLKIWVRYKRNSLTRRVIVI